MERTLSQVSKRFSFPPPRPEAVKKLLSSTFVPKGRVDFQSFRMRSLRLRVTRHGNKDMWLSELTAQWFNFQRLRSKASPIHPSFPFERCSRFFHTPPFSKGGGFVTLSFLFSEPYHHHGNVIGLSGSVGKGFDFFHGTCNNFLSGLSLEFDGLFFEPLLRK